MIVWGGFANQQTGAVLGDGGLYDPATDTWEPISADSAPQPRYNHAAWWTGDKMIVWGGGATYAGGMYNPSTGSWDQIPTLDQQAGPRRHSFAAFTGDAIVVWGGRSGTMSLNSGATLNLGETNWQSLTSDHAPSARANTYNSPDRSMTWTGHEVIVWGGIEYDEHGRLLRLLNDGGRYDPSQGTWKPINPTDLLSPRSYANVFAHDGKLVVWGGLNGRGYDGDGAIFDLATEIWKPIPLEDAPSARGGHIAVLGANRLIVWGGLCDGCRQSQNDGYVLDLGP